MWTTDRSARSSGSLRESGNDQSRRSSHPAVVRASEGVGAGAISTWNIMKSCPVCTYQRSEPPKPAKVNDLCPDHRRLWYPVKAMLITCGQVACLAVETDEVDFLAEAFTQELTSSPHRYPHANYIDSSVLCRDVEKCLRLLLLASRSITTKAECVA